MCTLVEELSNCSDQFLRLSGFPDICDRGLTFHSFLVTHCKITRHSLQICSLLVAEVARSKKSLVTHCKIRSFQNITRYSLQNLLITRCKIPLVARCKICLLLVADVDYCKKSLVTGCKIRSLLAAEVARCKKSLVTLCKICSLLVAEVESLFGTFLKNDSSTGVFL